MKNTFGNSIAVTLFGESHGDSIGAVIDGLAPGITVDTDAIAAAMDKRRPKGKISTQRRESDTVKIVSGVYKGKTTGTPLCLLIKNEEQRSTDYTDSHRLVRPGHADYTSSCKYHGYEDPRGGGHFSGRLTAPLVAAGAIASSMLAKKGITIGTHIKECAKVPDRDFCDLSEDIKKLSELDYAVLDGDAAQEMISRTEQAAKDGDSVGGILETAVIGIPAGLGEPWFDSVESLLSHAMFSIPGVKGIEFGMGFDIAKKKGSEANDPFYMSQGKVMTRTNNNGGINGGITNGMPIIFRLAVKPTPSIYKQQETVDIQNGTDAVLSIKGRHDPAIVHRARIVVDSLCALCLCDMLAQRYGTDYFSENDK